MLWLGLLFSFFTVLVALGEFVHEAFMWFALAYLFVCLAVGFILTLFYFLEDNGAQHIADLINAKIKDYASGLDDPEGQETGSRSP
jgi:hypothetical protein